MVLDGAGRAPPLDWHRLTVRVGGGVLDGGGRAAPLDWHRLTVHVGGGVVDGGGRAPPFDWHRLTVRVGEGGYLTAVGGHPLSIDIGSKYAWGGGGSGRRWEGTPIRLA